MAVSCGTSRWLNLSSCILSSLFSTLVGTAVATAQTGGVAGLRTVAETTDYRATASGADVEHFLQRLDRVWEAAELRSLGETLEGRPIRALMVEPVAGGPAQPLTVLLLGGIHSGECDGKEALLALARDMAAGQTPESFRQLRLIFVPNFNADGNERMAVDNRPGQAGPEQGMGIRENAQGLDLNRDFVKLETPEVRALVAALTAYDVDVLIDMHTTNGSLHRYDLTYDIPHNPAAPPRVDRWLRDELLPAVTERLEQRGIATFYYGNFEAKHTQWKTYGFEPRYSTEMMGLRGKIGILAESYSYASYQRRIEASDQFVREVLSQLAADQGRVRELLDAAAQDNQPGRQLPIRAALARTAEAATVRGYQQASGEPPTGPYNAESASRHEPKDYLVEQWSSAEPQLEILLPQAYAVAPQYAWALSRLEFQGVQLQRLREPLRETQVETYRISKIDSAEPFQGHALRTVAADVEPQTVDLPAGTYIIRTQQPLGALAAYLLEPSSDDGLAKWNFFDPYLTAGGTYPVLRLTGDVDARLLLPVEQVERGERMTFDHIMRPGQIVEYSSSSGGASTWLEGTDELLVRRQRDWYLVDPISGAARIHPGMERFAEALGELDEFKPEEARQRVAPAALTRDGRFGLVSHKRDLYFYDAEAGSAKRLTHTPEEDEPLAELSPTGQHVVFVRGNDLWAIDTQQAETRRLTENGSDELLNGILDWVYQEELYGRGNFKGFWFSPDGTQLAYLQLDQTPVQHYQVHDSISFRQTLEDTRYPKAGDPIPAARIWTLALDSDQQREVDLSRFPIEDRLIVRVTWSPDNQLWLQIQNRVQTRQHVVRVGRDSNAAETAFEELSPGWIEVLTEPQFLPGGDFLWLSDLPDGRRHLYRWDAKLQQLVALTAGDWDVAELSAISSDGQTAFVTGNISHPTETQLIAVDVASGQQRQLTTDPGTHRIRVSGSGKYFIDTFSSLRQPPITWLKSTDGAVRRVLAAPISDRHRYLAIREPELLTITARDGLELQSMILLPQGIEPHPITSGNTSAGGVEPEVNAPRLPVLFYVYGGPQAPTVSNAWQGGNYWWHQYLCQQGYAVVLSDNRSARGRGIKDTWTIHRDMGRVELADLEDAVDWVAQQAWADPQRIGMWGWSYGGYFTAYALTHSQKFRAGISGAPVTDWHNYDAIYTERYMGLPQENEQGYKTSSTVLAAKNLHGRLLLIHGERDDNVHMSNTLQLANALQRAGKPFEMMIYPKNRHGVVEPMQRFHLYQTMTDFLERNLKQ
jgi:dipeptidyl-peptidase 4